VSVVELHEVGTLCPSRCPQSIVLAQFVAGLLFQHHPHIIYFLASCWLHNRDTCIREPNISKTSLNIAAKWLHQFPPCLSRHWSPSSLFSITFWIAFPEFSLLEFIFKVLAHSSVGECLMLQYNICRWHYSYDFVHVTHIGRCNFPNKEVII
jgi:hypothetical protein